MDNPTPELETSLSRHEKTLHTFEITRHAITVSTVIGIERLLLGLNKGDTIMATAALGIVGMLIWIANRMKNSKEKAIVEETAPLLAAYEAVRGILETRAALSCFPLVRQIIENEEIDEGHRRRATPNFA